MTLPRLATALLPAILLCMSSCQAPEPLVPDRSYLLARNAVDRAKPCRIARFATVPVQVIHNRAFVQVWVNGVLTVGELDTGSEATLLTPATAEAAKLKPDPKLPRYGMYGISGAFRIPMVQAGTIQVGGLKVTRPPPVGVLDFIGSGKQIGALIGSSLVDGFDWDLDFAHGKMSSFITRNCHDIDPLWDTKSTGLPITRGTNSRIRVIASMVGLPLAITIPVEFAGGSLTAVFDTGASASYLTLQGARRAGITGAQREQDPLMTIGGIDGNKVRVRRHVVPYFAVGEELVRNFPLYIEENFDRRQNFDMLLGMDWIATHHLWLSYSTDSLYVDSGEKKPADWKPAPKLPE